MSGKIGLVVITLERYFKIVHAIAHRKHYREWMTYVAAAVPWVVGFFTIIMPAIIWTTTLPGRCHNVRFWTSEDGRKVRKLCAVFHLFLLSPTTFILIKTVSSASSNNSLLVYLHVHVLYCLYKQIID